MPLALMMKARGVDVCGSDRARDQGRTSERFAYLEAQGITLFPQDGSGVTADIGGLIVSSAVEEDVLDYQEAVKRDIPIRKRADLLAEMFNAAEMGIAVGGTSGKSTATAMIGCILEAVGRKPSIINGAEMKNFVTDQTPFASAVVGEGDCFVAEVDESDGSIALYEPSVAVLNNIALDHKTMEELRELFFAFASRAKKVILNLDNAETAHMYRDFPRALTYGLVRKEAALSAFNLVYNQRGVLFDVRFAPTGEKKSLQLNLPGAHNVSNALGALSAALAADVPFAEAVHALESFKGIARRFDVIGTEKGVTVIDDFAHNPDKIAALLSCLRGFAGRVLILFQPHGYGPLRHMKAELADCFVANLGAQDVLYIADPLYLGGTTDRSVTSSDLVQAITAQEGCAHYLADREACVQALVSQAHSGDRIVVMGARDDTLPALAKSILERLKEGDG